ncbi:phosphatidylglycerophosphatase A [Marinihelvus fidelis]|uniref:Phosphatidylglycerophosphatase A n=1 Tax=Marinihelvus fidelis TaxID=2613842 RepID=A0A5N0T7P1_9GAMM|nr:phosphatidylglycerophosphatase A [Marinihelvus fidelis]KAA9130748.1 phosphatidylglycerophosphatase A [Marinihelvus fidelis]
MTTVDRKALYAAFRSWDGFLAMGFGSGLSPRAPGTAGTLVAVPLAWLLQPLGTMGLLAVVAVTFAFGTWICDRVGRRLGVPDHGALVWDEFVGYWFAIAFAPPGWPWLLAGFVLFRIFDILKPWPIRLADRHVHGGFGVMLDDLIAGGFAALVLWGVVALVG